MEHERGAVVGVPEAVRSRLQVGKVVTVRQRQRSQTDCDCCGMTVLIGDLYGSAVGGWPVVCKRCLDPEAWR